MYLQNATGLDEIICFGLNPLVALLEHFEDEYLDLDKDPENKTNICWNLIKDVALSTQQASKQIHEHRMARKRL